MKFNNFKIIIAAFFLISGLTFSQNNDRTFKLVDLRRLVKLSSPKISPDGNSIAVIISRSDWDKDKNNEEIDLINTKDASSRTITYKREGISNLNWSPDGLKLSFIAKDIESKKSQIFVMPMNGGDPVCITNSKTNIIEYSWSPDGRKIAFVAEDTIPNPKAIKHHEDAFQVTDNNYLARAELQPWHIWIVSSNGGIERQLTKGEFSLCTDQETISQLAWNPDNKSITFQQFPNVWEGNAWHSIIAQVDSNGGKVSHVVNDEGSGSPLYSPEGNILAFIRPRNGDQNNGNAVYVDEKGKIFDITKKLARNFNSFIWMPDGKSLLLSGELGTQSVIWQMSLNGNASKLELGNIGVESSSISVSKNGAISFIGVSPDHPAELYVLASLNSKPVRLSDYNKFVDSLNIAKTEEINWKGPDNFDEDGVLTYPLNYLSGNKYPLVLVIHGGPEGASTINFSPLPQLLSAQGFFVFQPNYRGSINLGDAYQHAIFRNTGEGPGKDIMSGLEKVEKLGSIDTNKIAISGWSYGGYMSSWLNGYYPDKWKAAVEGAALNDWVMDYTIAYYQSQDLYFFGGSPWVAKYWKIWREQSPIELASNVKAPTLILGDAGDNNVPIVNSYEMYHALRDNGVHTEFYVYPADTHFPGDIVRTTDVYNRWIDWLVKYLK